MKLNINKTKFEKVGDVKVPDIFYRRLKTGIDVVDSAFGQGFLPSSTVVLSGEPGTGKTTFLLQILESLSIRKYNVGYVSGEECMELLKVNCDRIGVKNIMACNETNIDAILKQVPEFDAIVIDSFQSLNSSRDKSTSHEKYCVEQICAAAKAHQTTIFIITHITKSGKMKGSTLLPHSVDVVCNLKRHEDFDELEDKTVTLNITKNRFGPTLIKELNFTARGYDWTAVKEIPAESTVAPKSQRIKEETSTIRQIAEKIRDGKFSVDHIGLISNKPRAYYVLKKLTDDGVLQKVAKSGSAKTHYKFVK